jgi:hypothetical protein
VHKQQHALPNTHYLRPLVREWYWRAFDKVPASISTRYKVRRRTTLFDKTDNDGPRGGAKGKVTRLEDVTDEDSEDEDEEDEHGSMLRNRDSDGKRGVNGSSSWEDPLVMQERDLPRHAHRIYFYGDNCFGSPWRLDNYALALHARAAEQQLLGSMGSPGEAMSNGLAPSIHGSGGGASSSAASNGDASRYGPGMPAPLARLVDPYTFGRFADGCTRACMWPSGSTNSKRDAQYDGAWGSTHASNSWSLCSWRTSLYTTTMAFLGEPHIVLHPLDLTPPPSLQHPSPTRCPNSVSWCCSVCAHL